MDDVAQLGSIFQDLALIPQADFIAAFGAPLPILKPILHINHFSFPILQRIFRHGMTWNTQRDRVYCGLLSYVCRRWRIALLSMPELWLAIDLHWPRDIINFWVGRSTHTHHLEVGVRLPDKASWNHRFLQDLHQHSYRWSTLIARLGYVGRGIHMVSSTPPSPSRAADSFRTLMSTVKMPNLSRLDINIAASDNIVSETIRSHSFPSNMPSLQHLTLWNVRLRNMDRIAQNLKRLETSGWHHTPRQWATILRSCQKLEFLRFDTLGFLPSITERSMLGPDETILMPALDVLWLRMPHINAFPWLLNAMQLPKLRILTLYYTDFKEGREEGWATWMLKFFLSVPTVQLINIMACDVLILRVILTFLSQSRVPDNTRFPSGHVFPNLQRLVVNCGEIDFKEITEDCEALLRVWRSPEHRRFDLRVRGMFGQTEPTMRSWAT